MVSKLFKTSVLLLSLLSVSSLAFGQEAHFSQYNRAPLQLNPALTGAFFGDWKVSNNYRSQWSSLLSKPVTTIGLGFEKPIYLDIDKVAVGVFAMKDEAGGDKGFSTTRVAVSGAYHKLVDYSELRFGVQLAYTTKTIDKNLSFPEGFNRVTGEFDPELTELEPLARDQVSYLDVNFGVSWGMYFENFRPEVGLAMFHLNKPTESFYGTGNKRETQVAANASFKYFFNKNFYLDPNFMVLSQSKARNMLAGLSAGMRFDPNNAGVNDASFGFLLRNGFTDNPDAFIVLAGLGISNFDAGISYDFNISQLKEGLSNNGSFEISISYTAPSTRLIKTKIDSERL
ncbi:PorP/SprF family type IX secretion system membrane protein [Luteibaculum oceani]|nr:PorP/SprF family type IX secretion system membrane protein [Luteibaculum oceani]